MKKTLLLLLITLLVALIIYIVLHGFEIGKIEILSYTGIQKRDSELNTKIQEASKLTEKDYRSKISEVEQKTKELVKTKEEYENKVLVSTDGNVQQISTPLDKYNIETLWVYLGNYATAEGIVLQMNISNSSSGASGRYNLNFTVNGNYVSIADFISDIENDDKLGFKIEDFSMVEGSSATDLEAKFVCKDVTIETINGTNENTSTDTKDEKNKKSTNTTNSTDTTNTANSTNSTDTTNSTNESNTTDN